MKKKELRDAVLNSKVTKSKYYAFEKYCADNDVSMSEAINQLVDKVMTKEYLKYGAEIASTKQ